MPAQPNSTEESAWVVHGARVAQLPAAFIDSGRNAPLGEMRKG
jgi:hypothetical protein